MKRYSTFSATISIFLFFFAFLVTCPSFSQETIVLTAAGSTAITNDEQTGFADLVVGEAFKRIGYQLETIHLPAERALINANRGIDDGDLIRIAGLQKKYPNLVQVPEAVMVIDMVLFSKNFPTFQVNGWESVASHSLAIISGWKIMEKNFARLGGKVKIIKTDTAEQSFTLLAKDRVDFMAYSNWSGLGYLKAHNITDITLLKPPLASPKFYVYLHKKHNKIVPQLAEALRQIKADGSFERIFNKRLKPLMKNYQ
ncbi:MAG TPA: transporter substrate-binding domain-containing protein [Gammaproteobacteria bacterium]|nr:transporter substrate-binding domain-containing protein [Gammaproteobacteria bacterium]